MSQSIPTNSSVPSAATPAAQPIATAQAIPTAVATASATADVDHDDLDDEEGGSWFSRSVMYMITACTTSMLVHMVALIIMGLYFTSAAQQQVQQEIIASVEERPDEVVNQVLEEEIKPSKDLSLVSTAVSAAGAMGSVSALAEPQQLRTEAVSPTSQAVQVDVGEANVFKSSGTQLSMELPEGQLGEAQAISDSYQEAMDRVTAEILNKLAKNKVLVVWLFDQSESMEDDRAEIRARVDRVYQELGLAGSAKGDALVTSVCSFGEKVAIHTAQPTSDLEKIQAAIDEIPNDPSGFEMQCQAISTMIAAHRKFASGVGRQMMMIVVTDESGDPKTNVQYLESTIAEAKSAKCPLYFLGREAVFGYPYARMRWEDPMTGLPFWLVIDRGPETPLPEQLQFDGLHRRWDAHASGFGPYEQTRMARQTGGVFFMLPSPEANLVARDNRKYALEAMRPYLPDLSARADYVVERDKSPLRATIWKVINDLNPYNTANGRRIEVRHDFALDRPTFLKQAQDEMKIAMQLILYLQEAQKELEAVRPLRSTESSPRWRANFDMIYAQVLAYQVRLYEYGVFLDAVSKQPLPIKNIHGPSRPTTNWEIITRRDKLYTEDQFKHLVDQSEVIFRQIMIEHKGTPYETRAQWELNRGLSVTFREEWDNPAQRRNVKVPKL